MRIERNELRTEQREAPKFENNEMKKLCPTRVIKFQPNNVDLRDWEYLSLLNVILKTIRS